MRVVIAHGHIFKNAGSTFDWSLQRNFGDAFIDHRDDQLMRQEGPKLLTTLVDEQPQLKAISSHHMCHPPADTKGLRFLPLWFLRHPLERIRSVYSFERQQQSESPGAKAAKSMSFKHYIEWRMEPDVARTIRDYQTFYIAGRPRNQAKRPLAFSSLTAAIRQLRDAPCVGVVDRYDESMVVFEDSLRDDFPLLDLAYIRQNASRKRSSGLQAGVAQVLADLEDLAPQVLASNSYDLALYRAANQLLDQAIVKITDFPQRLEAFQKRCSALK